MAKRLNRKELLPPPEFTGSSPAATDQLSFVASDEDGRRQRVVSLAEVPGSHRLRMELLAGMASLNGPRGGWRSIDTVYTGVATVRAFLRWLDRQADPPESVADLNGALWNRWVLHNGGANTHSGTAQIHRVAMVLRHTPGTSPSLTAALSRRVGRPAPTVKSSYSEEQFRRIRRAARQVVHRASRRISSNAVLLQKYRSGAPLGRGEEPKAQALDELAERGVASSPAACRALGAYKGGTLMQRLARQELFLTPQEAWACAVLLAAETGWNPSVIDRLTVPEFTVGAGEEVEVMTIRLDKPRRGGHRHSTTTEVVEPGADTGRAVRWIIDATDPARDVLAAIGKPTDRLLVYGRWNGYTAATRFAVGPPTGTVRTDSVWAPLNPISMQRLRRTRQVLFDRTPTQNTRATHENVYVLNDTATQERIRPVIEDGVTSALRNASNYMSLRLVADELAEERIRSGDADTVFAACTDFEHHPDTGTMCRESFLACLGCSNSIATPRHLTRLLVLYSGLEELRGTVSEDEWRHRWEIHYLRLSHLLAAHCTDAERTHALNCATDHDRHMISRLLSGEFSA